MPRRLPNPSPSLYSASTVSTPNPWVRRAKRGGGLGCRCARFKDSSHHSDQRTEYKVQQRRRPHRSQVDRSDDDQQNADHEPEPTQRHLPCRIPSPNPIADTQSSLPDTRPFHFSPEDYDRFCQTEAGWSVDDTIGSRTCHTLPFDQFKST
jgi:hypothetical protein